MIKKDILNNHTKLLSWLKNLPFYYETDNQIFVHAGVDEEAEKYWKYGTSNDYFMSKYPATLVNVTKMLLQDISVQVN